jgi:hypothetical protein
VVVVVVDVEVGGSEVFLVAKMRLSNSNLGAWHYQKLKVLFPCCKSENETHDARDSQRAEAGKEEKEER